MYQSNKSNDVRGLDVQRTYEPRGTQCDTPVPSPRNDRILANITEQLHDRIKVLHSQCGRLESTADRLLGCQPSADDPDGITGGGPTFDLDQLISLVPFMDHLLRRLNSQVSRIERL